MNENFKININIARSRVLHPMTLCAAAALTFNGMPLHAQSGAQQLADAGVPVLLAQQLTGTVEPKQGTTLHVATTGSDAAGTGSAEAPYATPQKAVDLAQPGDTVYVHAGLYRGNIKFSRSGTADARISLVGEQGAVLDGGTVITGWELDPTLGESGVYRKPVADMPFVPNHMTWNHKYILRLNPSQAAINTPETYFARLTAAPTDKSWDGVESFFGVREEFAYVRFRNKQNPNNENLNFAPSSRSGGGVVNIVGQSFITVRGFTLQCGDAGVYVGPGSNDIIVENNFIWHGKNGVLVNGDARPAKLPPQRITIRNNRMTLNYVHDLSPNHPLRAYIWDQFKTVSDWDRQAVYFFYGGDDSEVYGNDIFQHWDGVQDSAGGATPEEYAFYCKRLKVYNNHFRDMGDDAMEPTGGEIDAEWHDNVSIDALIHLRLKDIKIGPAYFYRNRFTGGIRDIYYFAGTTGTQYLYHNTFATKAAGLIMGSTKPEIGLPNTWFINNIFSNDMWYRGSNRWKMDAHFHNNWLGGNTESYPWVTDDNILAPGRRLWDAAYPDFILTADSPAREKGIDLSKPVTLGGKTVGPFPGMKPGYFKGARPDLGAVQYGEKPTQNRAVAATGPAAG
jgi:hypothetical protein